MKRSLILCLLLAIVSITATGCSSCQSENKMQDVAGIQPVVDAQATLETAKAVLGDFTVVPAENKGGQLVPENVISTSRQWMFMNVSKDYEWFETEVEYEKTLTDSTQTGEIKQITNVFQKIEKAGTGFNVTVWQTFTNKSGTVYKYDNTFWLEDYDLSEVQIKLTFQDAYNRLMAANIPKPDTRFCVLRKPVSQDDRLLYFFGNSRTGVVAVDALTGDVFGYLGKPLGEWP